MARMIRYFIYFMLIFCSCSKGQTNYILSPPHFIPQQPPPEPPNDTIYLFLITGQSNADNRNELPSPVMQADSTVEGLQLWDETNQQFVQFKYDVFNGSGQTGHDDKWGFSDIALSYLHDSTHRKDIRAVKVTLGSTSLYVDGAPNGSWYLPFIDVTVGARMSQRVEVRWPKAVDSAETEGVPVKIVAVLWHQGEADDDPTYELAYEANFTNVVNHFRTVIGFDIPFIFGTIPEASASYNATVNAAQHDVAETLDNMYLIDLADGTLFDPYHFDSTTTLSFGWQVYNILKDLN